ncbi:MAG: PP2C family protein-serine/threonine phosphatase [Prevotella sp.]
MKIEIYQPQAIWELGQRDNQEDSIFPAFGKATDDDRLFILCDGMGGHEHGEVASRTVCKAMSNAILSLDKQSFTDDDLLDALQVVYRQLDSLDNSHLKKMGTTLCLLYFHSGGVTAAHIGDSRIYHVRPKENRILYQSRDHSLVYDLYQAGEISYDEMRTSTQKNIITRAIQPGEENRVRPAIVHITDIQPGDYFYICSDGMLEQMDNDGLCRLLSSDGPDEKKRMQLIAATFDNKDNHSAYLIHIKEVVREAGDDLLLDDEQTSKDNALNIRPQSQSDDVSIVSRPTPKPQAEVGKSSKRGYTLYVLLAVCIILVGGLGYKMLRPQKTIQRENRDPVIKTDVYSTPRPPKPISKTAFKPSEQIEHKSTPRKEATVSKQKYAKDSLKDQQKLSVQEKKSVKQKTKEEETIKKLKEGNKGKDLYNKNSQGDSNPKDKQEVNI